MRTVICFLCLKLELGTWSNCPKPNAWLTVWDYLKIEMKHHMQMWRDVCSLCFLCEILRYSVFWSWHVKQRCREIAQRFLHLSVAWAFPSSFTSFTGPGGFPVLLSPDGIVRARLEAQAPLADAEHWPANWFLHYTRLSSPSPSPFSLTPSFLLSLCLPLRVCVLPLISSFSFLSCMRACIHACMRASVHATDTREFSLSLSTFQHVPFT